VSESAEELLRSVWDETAAELAHLVAAMGIARGRAADVLQEVYLAAWRKCPPGADRAELRRWLFRVAVNRCHLEHRQRARWQRVLRGVARLWSSSGRGPDQEAGNTAEALCRQEDRELVRQALQRIEPRRRAVLVLRYFAGLDSKEIGRILELPDSTVRSQLRTARRQLAWELKRAGYCD
jgi:RNA polymerase sigma-70 factor (ECF subfamily)